jgi:multidrug efflux pump subunit AcrA (membrane-fusion protein)
MKLPITRQIRITSVLIIVLLSGALILRQFVWAHGDELDHDDGPTTTQTVAGIETVAEFNDELPDLANSSWSGEIISRGDTSVLPFREGQIASWNVAIGDQVRKGQVLGRLVFAPTNPELASALADRTAAIFRAEAGRTQTLQMGVAGRKRLTSLQTLLDASGKLNVEAIAKDAERTQVTAEGLEKGIVATKRSRDAAIKGIESEVAQSQASETLQLQQTKSDLFRLASQLASQMGISGLNDSSSNIYTNNFYQNYGLVDSGARTQYIEKLGILLQALKKSSLPEAEGAAYIKAAYRLLDTSIPGTIGSGVEISASHIADLRTLLSEDENRYLSSLQAFKLASKTTVVKQAEKEKILGEFERDISSLEANLKESNVDISALDIQKKKRIADSALEVGRQRSELDGQIAELDREIAMANAEAAGARAAYQAVASMGTGEQIVAVSDGVVSSIHKNIGDHVSPENPIADISSGDAERIIRFRLPYSNILPKADEKLTVELLGFPLEKRTATITGVGTALDDQGFLVAEANFTEAVNWPTHSQVKVFPIDTASSPLIPLSAIWWNEQMQPSVWLVMENNIIRPQEVVVGRTIGSRVEISDGLTTGDRFVPIAKTDLKAGQIIGQ